MSTALEAPRYLSIYDLDGMTNQWASEARSEVPPEAGSCEGACSTRIASIASQPAPEACGGRFWRESWWSGTMGAGSGRRQVRREGKWSRQARGGESKAKALAKRGAARCERSEAGRGDRGAERDACERASRNITARKTHAAGRVTKSARWPEGQPHAPRAVGTAFAAVAGARSA